MNQGTRFTKRCLAFLMAAILVASNFSGLAQFVNAVGDDSEIVSIGSIVANNYELTDAEKDLLSSGLLAGGTFEYTVPTDDDDLVSVDTENKTITAGAYGNWVPTSAQIIVNNVAEETVALTDGEGTYSYAGNAFSVKVTYVLNTTVDTATQELLLNAAANLKQGVANLDAVSAQSGNLYILEAALPKLAEMAANGMDLGMLVYNLPESAKTAINALNEQYVANGGKLDLSVSIETYDASIAETDYLVNQGAAMLTQVKDTITHVAAISLWLNSVSGFFSYLDADSQEKLTMLHGIIGNLETALTAVAQDPWTAANLGTDLVTGTNFAKLDALVAALGETTAMPEIKNELKVAETAVTMNMSMYNVTVKVALNVVNQNNQVVEYGYETVVLTLVKGATAAEIQDAVDASGIESAAITAWGDVFDAEHYVASATALPGSLTADTNYTITYNPKNYTVTYDYAASETKPYGYQMMLPLHDDPTQAYDYTVNGKSRAQGTIITIEGNTSITRKEGKAYVENDLLNIIAANYGNEKLDGILTSGALFGNEAINVRYPDANLLTLEGNVLTAESYLASYNSLSWAPYTYGAAGTENTFSGNTVAYNASKANVIYRLALTNFSNAEVKQWLELAVKLDEEAAGQINALDRLLAYKDVMGQLDKTKLGALNGVIDVTDFSADPVKNQELRDYFKSKVSAIINECLDDNNKLTIYNMMEQYENQGLIYYYKNSEAFLEQLELVSGYLNDMLADDEKIAALNIMVSAAGFPEYAEKIENVGGALATLQAELIEPNAAIDLNSDNLDELVDVLTNEELAAAAYSTFGPLYLYSNPLLVTDASMRSVQVYVNGVSVGSFTDARGTVLTAQDIADLKAAVVANQPANVKYYEESVSGDLDALIGTALDEDVKIYFTYTAKKYTVKVPGMEDQTINIGNLKIDLAQSADSSVKYTYTIDGVEGIEKTTYVFTLGQIDRLFTDGTYSVTREVIDMGANQLQTIVNGLNDKLGAGSVVLEKDADGNYTALIANVAAGELMDVVMALTPYSYIGLNGEGLMYMNEEFTTELSVQTLINAMLKDEGFNTDRLIALGNNGKGTLLTASLQLGNDENNLIYSDLEFVINLESVPSQMSTLAGALEQIAPYLSFQANNGVLEIEMNLPDKVYGAYLAALLTTGYADKNDMNAVDQEIAFMFLCDYLDAFIESGADLVTLENTLDKLGKDIDLSRYNHYYNAILQYVNYAADKDGLNVNISVPGQSVVDKLLGMIGMGGDDLNTYLAMVKEYKDGGKIVVNARGLLKNTEKNYNALILDAQAAGVADKFACTTAGNLNSVASNLSGAAIIILLDDVAGDLHIAGTTILDLNGKNVSGNIYAEGTLYIMDSSMSTKDAGYVGSVTGNATIVAGNYGKDVSAFLKDGYYMDGTTVRNALYHIEADAEGNVTFVINTDVFESEHVNGYVPDVRALALDMVSDLILNYFTTAAMTVDGNEVYNVNFDDLIALLVSSSKADDVIAKVLNSVDASGISGLTNKVIADLLDFEGLYEALCGDGVVATYGMTVAPWMIGTEVHADNYLVISVLANTKTEAREGMEESFNVSLKLAGDNADYIKNLVKELAGIVQDDTNVKIDIEQPTYADKEFDINVSGSALINVDMSANTDYAKILGVILAYGNADKRAAVAAAINADDMAALKAVVDNTTIAELFTALKAMSRNVNFATMASKVGVKVDVSTAAALEQVYHLSLCTTGKALEELDITGMNSKLGNLDQDGVYVLTRDKMIQGELNLRSYSALYKLTADDVTIKLKLFGDTEHVHSYEAVVTAPTCTEKGYTTHTCDCGDSYVTDEVPALGHSFGEWIVEKKATCTETGLEKRVCGVCGEIETRDIPVVITWGDVNHDGKVNSADAMLILKYCVDEPIPGVFCEICADVSGDGVINSADAMLILQYCVDKINKFPAEG